MTRKPKPPLYTGPISDEDKAAVMDNPEWTDEELAAAKPFAEVFPEMAASIRRGRGKAKKPTKAQITLRIDRDTLDAFRATGPGWQSRMASALAAAKPDAA